MNVVLAGPRDYKEELYQDLVNKILDDCQTRYSKLLIIVRSCDFGVGKIVKTRCLSETNPRYPKPEFDMIEFWLKHYVTYELNRHEFMSHFDSLNGPLVELGEEFHIISEDMPKGSTVNLLRRVQQSGRAYAIYRPSEFDKGVKRPVVNSSKST